MNGTDTTPVRWCAICLTSYVREPADYLGACCQDDGLKVTALAPTPVKAGTPVSAAVWPWSGSVA